MIYATVRERSCTLDAKPSLKFPPNGLRRLAYSSVAQLIMPSEFTLFLSGRLSQHLMSSCLLLGDTA